MTKSNKDNNKEYLKQLSEVENDLTEVTSENDLKQAYNQLFDDQNLSKKTELTQNEIARLSTLKTYADTFGFTGLSALIDNFLRMRISLKREGRKEHVKVAQAKVLQDAEHIKSLMELDKAKRKG